MVRHSRFLVSLIAILLPFLSAAAQQKPNETTSSGQVVQQAHQQKAVSEENRAALVFTLTTTMNKQKASATPERFPRPLFTNGPTFVFKDGAVHLSIFPDSLLIPLSGGGASGCFSSNLPDRSRTLWDFLQMLPSVQPQKRR